MKKKSLIKKLRTKKKKPRIIIKKEKSQIKTEVDVPSMQTTVGTGQWITIAL